MNDPLHKSDGLRKSTTGEAIPPLTQSSLPAGTTPLVGEMYRDVEQIKGAFFKQFTPREFRLQLAHSLREMFPNKSASALERIRDKMGRENLSESYDIESRFAIKVIETYARWSKEDKAVVLWDVDETMGCYSFFWSCLNSTRGEDDNWGFRPAFLCLTRVLLEHFPNIENGILSAREKPGLLECLKDAHALQPIANFISAEHVYSSEGSQQNKLAVLATLRSLLHLNVKLIDDDRYVLEEEARGNGICISPGVLDHCILPARS